jgi:hypothetical protein
MLTLKIVSSFPYILSFPRSNVGMPWWTLCVSNRWSGSDCIPTETVGTMIHWRVGTITQELK